MTTDEDARDAARRIVQQVLAAQSEQVLAGERAGPSDPDALADAVVDDAVAVLTGEHSVARAEELVEDAVAVIAVDAEIAVEVVADTPVAAAEPPVSEPRARARALVAEVLTAHEGAMAAAASGAGPGGAVRLGSSAPSTPSRVRARELVAAALAEEQEREAEGRAHAEAAARVAAEEVAAQERERQAARRIEAARHAEEERAAAARARAEQLEQERRAEAERAEIEAERARVEADRAAAEEAERRQWADADRDAATATTPMAVHGQVVDGSTDAAHDPRGDDPDTTRPVRADVRDPDRTTPLSIAELAASGHLAERGEPEWPETYAVDDRDGPGAEAGMTAVLTPESPASAELEGEDDDAPPTAEGPVVGSPPTPGVLEATVEPESFEPRPRTGRWLIASIVGAVTLAIVFPLAIRALLQLVSLS